LLLDYTTAAARAQIYLVGSEKSCGEVALARHSRIETCSRMQRLLTATVAATAATDDGGDGDDGDEDEDDGYNAHEAEEEVLLPESQG